MPVIDLDLPPHRSSPERRSRARLTLILMALGLGFLTGEPAGPLHLDSRTVCGVQPDDAAAPTAGRQSAELVIDPKTGHIVSVRCSSARSQ
ncbi:hypothetical protein D7147_08385 [Micromonospora musae]|uniref:Uncharacterized protein n=1 Tax=Micromonospora musae TaxID=1894970 RepID=A0A3A9Y6S2_9ACTN|nr:hypothetical protein D7147_08385 [Micromonospora musae]RKN32353.1 hypothetical protein D7044_13980 [Micromonospora musae]